MGCVESKDKKKQDGSPSPSAGTVTEPVVSPPAVVASAEERLLVPDEYDATASGLAPGDAAARRQLTAAFVRGLRSDRPDPQWKDDASFGHQTRLARRQLREAYGRGKHAAAAKQGAAAPAAEPARKGPPTLDASLVAGAPLSQTMTKQPVAAAARLSATASSVVGYSEYHLVNETSTSAVTLAACAAAAAARQRNSRPEPLDVIRGNSSTRQLSLSGTARKEPPRSPVPANERSLSQSSTEIAVKPSAFDTGAGRRASRSPSSQTGQAFSPSQPGPSASSSAASSPQSATSDFCSVQGATEPASQHGSAASKRRRAKPTSNAKSEPLTWGDDDTVTELRYGIKVWVVETAVPGREREEGTLYRVVNRSEHTVRVVLSLVGSENVRAEIPRAAAENGVFVSRVLDPPYGIEYAGEVPSGTATSFVSVTPDNEYTAWKVIAASKWQLLGDPPAPPPQPELRTASLTVSQWAQPPPALEPSVAQADAGGADFYHSPPPIEARAPAGASRLPAAAAADAERLRAAGRRVEPQTAAHFHAAPADVERLQWAGSVQHGQSHTSAGTAQHLPSAAAGRDQVQSHTTPTDVERLQWAGRVQQAPVQSHTNSADMERHEWVNQQAPSQSHTTSADMERHQWAPGRDQQAPVAPASGQSHASARTAQHLPPAAAADAAQLQAAGKPHAPPAQQQQLQQQQPTPSSLAQQAVAAGVPFVDEEFLPGFCRDLEALSGGAIADADYFRSPTGSKFAKALFPRNHALRPTGAARGFDADGLRYVVVSLCLLLDVNRDAISGIFPGLLAPTRRSRELFKVGAYSSWWCLDGWWTKVCTDNIIPKPEFLGVACADEVTWPSLVVKAYAKARGSLRAVAGGGTVGQFLQDVTGCPYKRIPLVYAAKECAAYVAAGRDLAAVGGDGDLLILWEDIKSHVDTQRTLGVSAPESESTARHGKGDCDAALQGSLAGGASLFGLDADTTLAVLAYREHPSRVDQCEVKIRNRFGWSNAAAAVGKTVPDSPADKWITYREMLEGFDSLTVCYTTPSWNDLRVRMYLEGDEQYSLTNTDTFLEYKAETDTTAHLWFGACAQGAPQLLGIIVLEPTGSNRDAEGYSFCSLLGVERSGYVWGEVALAASDRPYLFLPFVSSGAEAGQGAAGLLPEFVFAMRTREDADGWLAFKHSSRELLVRAEELATLHSGEARVLAEHPDDGETVSLVMSQQYRWLGCAVRNDAQSAVWITVDFSNSEGYECLRVGPGVRASGMRLSLVVPSKSKGYLCTLVAQGASWEYNLEAECVWDSNAHAVSHTVPSFASAPSIYRDAQVNGESKRLQRVRVPHLSHDDSRRM